MSQRKSRPASQGRVAARHDRRSLNSTVNANSGRHKDAVDSRLLRQVGLDAS